MIVLLLAFVGALMVGAFALAATLFVLYVMAWVILAAVRFLVEVAVGLTGGDRAA